ncbi:lipocalin-like domain-containing protein [Cryptosporangium aurantiacum]|uniref:Predicted secreted hydrolase n=1 Tax=Cryptosporangium aurantiacum TaxID=134849 RepID=A0A1M7RBD5_9ACTN|nr:lipocalin-like domain-containing protein [Cryptosporangium aurantiacum]SHN43442.1 Predicted secreted hydrolase [Cryptosporangium aurantiacum]
MEAQPVIPVAVEWPKSEGVLDDAGLQLWWVTALLESDERHLSAFAMVTAVGSDLLMVTTVLSDRASGTELGARREFVPLAEATLGAGEVEVAAAGVHFSGSQMAGYRLSADLGDGIGFDLTLEPTRPVLFSCATGEFPWREQTTTKQYASGGLAARGEARFGGTTMSVAGSAWYDRQWWATANLGSPRFCWFGLWLDNGDTLSVWDRTVDDESNGLAWATLVRPDGTHVTTPLAPFALTAQPPYETYLGNQVPLGWDLELPGVGMSLAIRQVTVQDDPGRDFFTGALEVEGSMIGAVPLAGRGVSDLIGLRGAYDR